MRFRDRAEAASQLIAPLRALGEERPVIAALARGGVVPGVVLARAFAAELLVLQVRKIGAPGNPELAVGAVCDGAQPQRYTNRPLAAALGCDDHDLERLADRELAEIERRKQAYRGHLAEPDVRGRTVFVTDDGIATGATMAVAIDALHARGAGRIVLAVPVASGEALELLRPRVDEIVCLYQPDIFYAVGAHYDVFGQVADEEVIALLDSLSEGSGAR